MTFSETRPGLFVVRYETSAELAPAMQEPLVSGLRRAAAEGPCALVFVLTETVETVDLAIPSYWLGVTSDRALRLVAVAVVAQSFAVRIATKGFGVRNQVIRSEVSVRHFEAEAPAVEWVGSVLAARTPSRQSG